MKSANSHSNLSNLLTPMNIKNQCDVDDLISTAEAACTAGEGISDLARSIEAAARKRMASIPN